MKCYNCGFESPDGFAYCPKCGAAAVSEPQWAAPMQAQRPSQAIERITMVLKDSLFLALCILFTVGTVVPLINRNFSVISILLTIFLWLVYAKSQKDIVAKDHLRNISGTVFAMYVVYYVGAGALALGGLCFIIFGSSGNAILSEILLYMDVDVYGMAGFMSVFMSVIGFAFIIAAVAVALVNFFGIKSIHRFAQSVYKGLDDDTVQPIKAGTASAWLMVFGIFTGINAASALFNGNLVAFIASGASCAADIIAFMLVKKYFD